eukprot:scaffold19828_cov58-Skeletonema_marinoi.AAC.1
MEAPPVPRTPLCCIFPGPDSALLHLPGAPRADEIKSEDGTRLEFMCLTMVDPATGWFEVVELPTAE